MIGHLNNFTLPVTNAGGVCVTGPWRPGDWLDRVSVHLTGPLSVAGTDVEFRIGVLSQMVNNVADFLANADFLDRGSSFIVRDGNGLAVVSFELALGIDIPRGRRFVGVAFSTAGLTAQVRGFCSFGVRVRDQQQGGAPCSRSLTWFSPFTSG